MIFALKFWSHSSGEPIKHGYTAPTDWEMATLRIGPLVIGWELIRDE